MTYRRSAPAASVLAVALASWLLTGVAVGDIALFLGHELAFVLVPGCLALAACTRRSRGALELAAIGYALGSVLEVLAFAVTAALQIRGALWLYPPLTIAVGALWCRRRGRLRDIVPTPCEGPGAAAWALAGVCAVAIVYLTVAYFLSDPLPSPTGSAVYIPDLVFHLGVAAEALHHWPITDPKVAGVALPYETFVYMKLAATSQITQIALPTVFFRLYLLPLVVAVAALLASVGTRIGGRRSVGVVAALLFLLVGQLGLDPHDSLVFYNTVFFSLYDSPTYAFGLVVFLAALAILLELLGNGHGHGHGGRGTWLVLVVLLIGCAGAKASILPDLLGGLVLYVIWRRVGRDRVRDRSGLVALAVVAVVFVATYLLIYHGETGGLAFNPPGSIREMSVVEFIRSRVGGPAVVFWVVASVFGLIGFCGPSLAGIPFSLGSRALRAERSTALLAALLTASLLPFLLFTHKGGSQNFFAYYGICAACVLSARGLVAAWDRARPLARGRRRALTGLSVAWVGLLLTAAALPFALSANPPLGPLYALWLGLPALAVLALALGASRSRRRDMLLLASAGVVVLAGALDTPLHTGTSAYDRLRSGKPLYASDSPQSRGLDPGLSSALDWIRTRTPVNAVIAVNNQFSDADRQVPTYYYYSAFGQRRVFLEGWVDTLPAASLPPGPQTPFPRRLALNDALFMHASRRALAVMTGDYGVRYLLVDRRHGPDDPALAQIARPVFANRAATVYRIGPGLGAGPRAS